jgi:tetratricopeptide (TPR) repeat protein/tRNA A-37 threonylcarbamoyl transferase component Bud32
MSRDDQELIREALRRDPADRRAFLDHACGNDSDLRARIERQIERQIALEDSATIVGDGGGTTLRTAGVDAGSRMTSATAGRSIGGYRLLDTLGAGAMGIVYRAEQHHPRRQVALKVIRASHVTDDMRARFELEARTLGRLRHPGIAQIFDAGTASVDGVSCPYFAMELIDGPRIDVALREVSIRVRLEGMIEVCEAVEHAHVRGVMHCDIKPANVLVDGDGRPRILDFGVARALDVESAVRQAGVVGTIPYMSPEQLRGEGDLDTRSDVYALGAVLYEVIAGHRPRDLEGNTVAEAREIVTTTQVAPLTIADRRYSADLNAIVRRAMARERDDRYASAGALAEDLRRSLRRFPVDARAHTRGYMLSRYAQRHRGLVAGLAIAATAMTGGAIGVTWQAIEATRGRAEARADAERLEAVNEFVAGMLASADPERAMGEDLTVRELLDEAALLVGLELTGRPHVESAVRLTLSNTYRGLGELDAALFQARQMVAVCTRSMQPDDPRMTDALQTLGLVLVERGETDEAIAVLDDAIARIDRRDGPRSSAGALARNELARAYHQAGRSTEAMAMWSESLDVVRSTLGVHHEKTLILMHNFASVTAAMGDLDSAESMLREVVEQRTALFSEDHPQTLGARSMLAGVMQQSGRDREAAEELRRVFEARRRILGDDHHSTITSMGNLAVPLVRLGELEEAEQLTRDSLEGYRRTLGETHPKALVVMSNLAYLLEDQGKDDDAAALYVETIDLMKRVAGGRDPQTWPPMNNLAMLYQRQGRLEESAALFKELLELCAQSLPANHYYTAIFRNNYGSCLTELGRLSEAAEALRGSHAILEATFGTDHERVIRSRDRLEKLDARHVLR